MDSHVQKNVSTCLFFDEDAGQAGNISVEVQQWKDDAFKVISDPLSQEVPVLLRYGEQAPDGHWTELGERELWAWPKLLHELALGNAILEGRQGCSSEFAVEEEIKLGRSSRSGLPFHSSFKATVSTLKSGQGRKLHISPPGVVTAMRGFMGAPGLWDDTGCFHRAGIFDPGTGCVLKVAEDIGRHNCLDRLTGWSALSDIAVSDYILLVSARMSASLCRKALKAGFRFMISRSAVTTASVAMCQDAGTTLIGFARDRESRFTVFNDSESWVG